MDKIDQGPTYYPIPYEIGIACPAGGCGRLALSYCYNPLATFYTMTNEKEQYHFIHKLRRKSALRYLTELKAYYKLKTLDLTDRTYLIGRYYPLKNSIYIEETGEHYPRDLYTFHGYTHTPLNVGVYYNKQLPGRTVNTLEEIPHNSEELDFNF